jgi:hypothetical protein
VQIEVFENDNLVMDYVLSIICNNSDRIIGFFRGTDNQKNLRKMLKNTAKYCKLLQFTANTSKYSKILQHIAKILQNIARNTTKYVFLNFMLS